MQRQTKNKMKKAKQTENKYYSLSAILDKNADYNIIFGERSNGKTYAALMYGLARYAIDGVQTAYVRRWREDLKGKRAESLFAAHVQNGVIEKLTDGNFNAVVYQSNKYYLAKFEAGKKTVDDRPFAFAFCLSESEHDKSTSYPNVQTIIFDEFITRRYYLPDEFMLFMNVLSTIIRDRDGIKIFMLGNTVNQYCPYFAEFGLKNITTMQQGAIDVYKFGKDGCTVAVEYAETTNKEKKSNKYFCFDNQNLQMITGGKWEFAVYPHLPTKYLPRDVVFVFYIVFNDTTLQANIIANDTDNFIFIHAKTTAIKDETTALIYSLQHSGKPNYHRRLCSTVTEIDKKITKYFADDRVFFQSNEIGEIVRNYIQVSGKNNLFS